MQMMPATSCTHGFDLEARDGRDVWIGVAGRVSGDPLLSGFEDTGKPPSEDCCQSYAVPVPRTRPSVESPLNLSIQGYRETIFIGLQAFTVYMPD